MKWLKLFFKKMRLTVPDTKKEKNIFMQKRRYNMKKVGLIVGISFLAGALFFALTFGYFQKSNEGKGNQEKTILAPSMAKADSLPAVQGGMSFAPLVSKVRPAVVKVMSEAIIERGGGDIFEQFFNIQPRREKVPGVGSGFFISSDGYIITNNHVVKDAVKVKVKTIDDKEFTAKIIGTDPKTDLALIKVNTDDAPFIQLGDSNKVEVGEWVLAIGNPLNQDLSVTAGIISAKGRQLGVADYEDFLQTDAAINQGNSGGPLINMEGKVIGINSIILSTSGGNIGLGFAIPSNLAQKVVKDLKSKGRVVRGWLGVGIQNITEKEAKDDFDLPSAGVLVVKVDKDSPADRVGLKKYDLIVGMDGKKIKTATELSTQIAEANPGDTIELEIYREKDKKTVKVKIGESPDTEKYTSQGDDKRTFDLGMILVENSRALSRDYDLKISRGLVVKSVEKGSSADESGMREGDVILEVNGKAVDTVEQFRKIISGKRPGSQVMIFINRFGEEGVIRFRIPE